MDPNASSNIIKETKNASFHGLNFDSHQLKSWYSLIFKNKSKDLENK